MTAVVGIALGTHGWSARHNGVPSTLAGSQPSASAPGAKHRATSPGPGASGGASTPPTQGPTASPAPSTAAKPGPKLSSQSYASYSFAVWPGTPSASARAAATGLTVKVTKKGSGILVQAGVAGQPLPAAVYYPTGTKVYIIEASMGDDASNSDYNLGDDGLVVTDAQGRILQ